MDPALKQRLVGAIVLVALAVIFVPMLLDGSGVSDRVDQNVEIPEVPKPTESDELESRLAETPEPEAIPDDEIAPDSAPEPESDAPADGPSGYAIQVGSFTREANATALRNRLRDAGFSVFVRAGESGGEQVWRVRVGPVAREGEAERLRDQVLDVHGEPAIIVSHP